MTAKIQSGYVPLVCQHADIMYKKKKKKPTEIMHLIYLIHNCANILFIVQLLLLLFKAEAIIFWLLEGRQSLK